MAISQMREQARALFDLAVQAANPSRALARSLQTTPFLPPDPGGRTFLIAVGKAAPGMLAEAQRHVTGPVHAVAVTHHENRSPLSGATLFHAGHPVPDADGLAAGAHIMDLLASTSAADRVIALISGGGSSLLPAPVAGVSLADKIALNSALLAAGLDIVQMNLIRQQVSQLKGGGLAHFAAPAPVQAYILSDVIGDDIRAIASGPTADPIGTSAEARTILQDAGIWDDLPAPIHQVLNRDPVASPKSTALNTLIGSNHQSLDAMVTGDPAGRARIINPMLIGDVKDAAQRIVKEIQFLPIGSPYTLLFGGETTVNITGTGLGGRNQELALRVALGLRDLPGDWVFLSGGTDGRDGPTDAAGGLVDPATLARIAAAAQDVQALLANNDSNTALAASGDLLMTGATGTNVADIQIFMRHS